MQCMHIETWIIRSKYSIKSLIHKNEFLFGQVWERPPRVPGTISGRPRAIGMIALNYEGSKRLPGAPCAFMRNGVMYSNQ